VTRAIHPRLKVKQPGTLRLFPSRTRRPGWVSDNDEFSTLNSASPGPIVRKFAVCDHAAGKTQDVCWEDHDPPRPRGSLDIGSRMNPPNSEGASREGVDRAGVRWLRKEPGGRPKEPAERLAAPESRRISNALRASPRGAIDRHGPPRHGPLPILARERREQALIAAARTAGAVTS
jgi:hypothetical protein